MKPDKKYKILLVDDEKDLCDIMAWELEDSGFIVSKAYSGEEALDLLDNQNYDFLISDIKMPMMDGVQMINKIKDHGKIEKGIFLMTGFTHYTKENLDKLGVVKIFEKPIDIEKMIRMLEKYKK